MKKRLLLVNPNTNLQVTRWLAEEAERVAGAGYEVLALNADSGLAALHSREDILRAERAVVDVVSANRSEAVVIAAFGDPGLEAARAATSAPVAGLGEAGMREAAARGGRFTVITLGAAMRDPIAEKARSLGLGEALREIVFLPFSIADMVADRWARRAEIAAAIEAQAEGPILLGGAPFAGMAATLARETGRDVIDGVEAACRYSAPR